MVVSKAAVAQEIFVRATGSDGGITPTHGDETPTDTSSFPASSHPDCQKSITWYDCEEEFAPDHEQPYIPLSVTGDVNLNGKQAGLCALPAELAAIVYRYKQGCFMGCKPTVALLKFMERTNTSIEQLQQQLAGVLAAEQAGADLPTPTQQTIPHKSLQQVTQGDIYSICSTQVALPPCHRCTHSVARLLENVELVNATLFGMAQEDGFKQVAWGNLEMWYMHDHVNHRQVIKARTILDEPVVHTTCLAREVDLVTSWNPAISEAKELTSYSPSELLTYMLCWTPWPLPSPEIVNYGIGIDLLDTKAGCVLIATKGKNTVPEGVTLPVNNRAVRVKMDAGGFKFVPLPPDPDNPEVPRMEATVLVSIDAHRFVVPSAVISFVLKVFAPLVYKSVVKVLSKHFHPQAVMGPHADGIEAEGVHTELLHRLQKRPEYAAIDEHVKMYIAAKQAQQEA